MNRNLFLQVIILGLVLFSCQQNSEKEIFILPYNYEGVVIILFNEKNGAKVVYKDDYRLYQIPNNGVLKTQFTPNDGILLNPNKNSVFYQQDSLGHLEQLKVNWNNKKSNNSSKMINYQKRGERNGVDYFQFIVSIPIKSDSFIIENSFKEKEWFDSITGYNPRIPQ